MRTSQLNVGGNMDFYNMLERERLESKKISKTNAVTSIMDHKLPADDIYIGPSDYVPWLTDRKWAHIRVEGQAFGDVPLNVELKLEVWDSPNSAGIVIDAVRCCKLALNHGVGGQLDGPSSYLMKSPHNQRPDDLAREDTEKFIAKYTAPDGRLRDAPKGRTAPGSRTATRTKSRGAAIIGRGGHARPRFSVAHVTPYPWEAGENEVNAHVARLAGELSRRGHRVLILAPSRAPSACALRAASCAPPRPERTGPDGRVAALEGTNAGTPARDRVGEVLDVPSAAGRRPRSLPDRRCAHARGAVHAHPARLRTRPRAVRAEHVQRGSALLALAQRGLVPHAQRALTLDHARAPLRGELPRASRRTPRGRATAERHSEQVERVYRELASPPPRPRGDPDDPRRRLLRRPLIDVDLHMHTDHSHDCATPVEVLLAAAREAGLGAIAVTDHNEISGALEAREKAAESGAHPPVKVIVGEEVKTAGQGEVIGLFIEEKIPRGMTLADTVAEIKRQGGLVYVPHPFDRMHSVPDYEHLLPILDDIDAIEVFNPRVAIGSFNEEAVRFAAKYRLVAGAGSDSHVAQGLGSVRIRMRDFDGPQEFLQSLRDAEITTKPSSLIYVQALKFLQTKATPAAARRASRERRVRRATRGGGGTA